MNEFRLVLARPESVEDCVAEPFRPLVRSPLWVAYPTYGRRYLADVNDDPDRESEYDTGLGRWVELVQALLRALFLRSGGRPVQISVPTTGADRDRTVEEVGTVDPDMVEGLTTYGGTAMMWTSLPEASWGVSHGYKEPFLVAHVPALSGAALGELIQAQTGDRVEMADDPFVPHRVRMHRRSAS